MLVYLLRRAGGRKLRLFAVACCRRIQHFFSDQNAIERRLEIAELYADGFATAQELRAVEFLYLCGGGVSFERFGHDAACDEPGRAAMMAQSRCEAAAILGVTKSRPAQPEPAERPSFLGRLRRFFGRPVPQVWSREVPAEYGVELSAQCDLLREIFGNPLQPLAFSSSWRTSDVMLLANGIYEEKAFDRMPILADALQDAGCDAEELLTHLRDPHATHVRGCWALDLVLGKE